VLEQLKLGKTVVINARLSGLKLVLHHLFARLLVEIADRKTVPPTPLDLQR
jgi:hypothetical protein